MQNINSEKFRFNYVKEKMKQSNLKYPEYLIQNFEEIRQKCEKNIEIYYKNQELEENQYIEISLKEIYNNIANIFGLNDEQVMRLNKLGIRIRTKIKFL